MDKKIKEFLENFPSEEREQIYASAMELKKQFELRDKAKKRILESEDYILWLCKFTETNSKFSSDDWLYSPEEISEEDMKNVLELEFLFEIISDFAENNYLPMMPSTWGGYYTIKYNNILFDIEVASGQGTVFTCERIESSSNQVIDFKLIKRGEELPTTKEISSKFNIIKRKIMELKQDVSTQVLKKEIMDFVNNIDLL